MGSWVEIRSNSKKIVVWGAGDQFRVNFPIFKDQGIEVAALIDDTPEKVSPFVHIPLILGDEFEGWLSRNREKSIGFVIAIGNPYGHVRTMLSRKLKRAGLSPVSFADASSLIRDSVVFGEGLQVMPKALIHNDVQIGHQCIINTGAIVEHDCILGDGVEIGPGATLCGRVIVGENTWIGAGAVIRPRVKIGKNTIVGLGAVVVNDIPDGVVVVGSPARPLIGKIPASAINEKGTIEDE